MYHISPAMRQTQFPVRRGNKQANARESGTTRSCSFGTDPTTASRSARRSRQTGGSVRRSSGLLAFEPVRASGHDDRIGFLFAEIRLG